MATSSIDGLLAHCTVSRARGAPAPLVGAARLLERFGAVPDDREGSGGAPPGDRCGSLRLNGFGGPPVEVRLAGRLGGGALPEYAALEPNGSPLSAYTALRLAAAALGGRSVTLHGDQLVRDLMAALRFAGPNRPELLRCRDGWAVARWRDEHEPRLLRALVGGEATRADTVAAAREARLLVGAVRRPRPRSLLEAEPAGLHRSVARPRSLLEAEPAGSHRSLARPRDADRTGPPACAVERAGFRPRVVDWTVLWAGPWVAQELRRSGADVERVEHPRRRDGLLAWPGGRAWWRRLNHGKRLSLLDARDNADRARLEQSLAGADVLLTSMTPRALRSLGYDDDWRAEHAPHLLHLELVAFDGPWADAPGLGEHASAEAGLLWSRCGTPRTPYPWADPLLGGLALLLARAWLASGRARGERVRLSLERAASLAFAT